jgi:hypothetical protein
MGRRLRKKLFVIISVLLLVAVAGMGGLEMVASASPEGERISRRTTDGLTQVTRWWGTLSTNMMQDVLRHRFLP